jgi:ribulose-phosphate 3-epimerase
MAVKISASIVAGSTDIKSEAILLEKTPIYSIHLDILEPAKLALNVSPITSSTVSSLRKYTEKILDVHLMVPHPEKVFESFIRSGADAITVHCDSVENPLNLIRKIKSRRVTVGVAISPAVQENVLEDLLEEIDMVTVMTVEPGLCGQEFMTSQLPKIGNIRSMIDRINPMVKLQVDGGINPKTALQAVECGADILVSGSYLFKDLSNLDTDKKLSLLQSKIELLCGV